MGMTMLVRHGQASYGASSYDVLSELGHRQAAKMGALLAGARGAPASIRTGTLVRQRDTAAGISAAFGGEVAVEPDARWNEFELSGIMGATMEDFGIVSSSRFQDLLDTGVRAWARGAAPALGGESHFAFTTRVQDALTETLDQSRNGAQIVVTSAGVISWIAASLLGGGVDQWLKLNRVCVNASGTRIVSGARGTSLISFNEHGHLLHSEITYR